MFSPLQYRRHWKKFHFDPMISAKASDKSERAQNNYFFETVNSSSVINRLHMQSKENQRLYNSSKKELQTQIRKTSYKVKISKFRKKFRLSCLQQKQNQQGLQTPSSKNRSEEQECLQKPNTFESFLRKKRVDNSELKQMMKLFSNTITDRAKANIEKQISKQVAKIQQRKTINTSKNRSKQSSVRQSQEELDENKLKKIKNFAISHMILEKVMSLMMQDPKYIRLKHENESLYKKLKSQMLEVIIHNDKIMKALAFFQTELKQDQIQGCTFSWSKLKQIQMRRKPFYLLKEEKNDELAEQISRTFQTLKELVQQSFKDFHKPEQAYHLQQLWDHREDNIPLLKAKKLVKSQKSVRITTIQRLKPLESTTGFEEA